MSRTSRFYPAGAVAVLSVGAALVLQMVGAYLIGDVGGGLMAILWSSCVMSMALTLAVVRTSREERSVVVPSLVAGVLCESGYKLWLVNAGSARITWLDNAPLAISISCLVVYLVASYVALRVFCQLVWRYRCAHAA